MVRQMAQCKMLLFHGTCVECFCYLSVCLRFYVQLKNFSLIRRRYHYQWRLQISTFTRHSWSLSMVIEHWGSFSMPHLLWHGVAVYDVISEEPWHLHLLSCVWRWSYHYLFLQLISVEVGIRTPNLPHASRTL